MKPKKLLLTALTVLCMTILLCTGAFAVDLEDTRFADLTWEEVVANFLAERNIDPGQVTIGYYNTVTGEENYLNPEQLMYGASVAKLPTNMLFAERVSKGEMTMDTPIRGTPYETLQQLSLIKSDNPAMTTMVTELGGGSYARFRTQILPYIGETEETVDNAFLARNFFNARQILYTLKLLYGNEEKYPGVEECLKQASQYDYFMGNRPPYTVAHKYGWYVDKGVQYVNDSAIIYTDDPILLVMFTGNVEDATFVLADFCSLMCDYAQYHRVLRYAGETYEHTDLTIPAAREYLSVDTPSQITEGYAPWQLICIGAGLLLLILALVLIVKRELISMLPLLLSLLLIAGGGAPTVLAHLAVQNGTPQQVVAEFAEAFHTNTRGIELLDNCDSAMAHSEGTDAITRIENMIDQSFTLTANTAVRTGNCIAVSVTATKVNIPAVAEDLQARWEEAFDAALAAADPVVLYDAEGVIDSTVSDSALDLAIADVLNNRDSFLYMEDTTLYLTLTLDGITPTWKIVCTEELLDLVNYG